MKGEEKETKKSTPVKYQAMKNEVENRENENGKNKCKESRKGIREEKSNEKINALIQSQKWMCKLHVRCQTEMDAYGYGSLTFTDLAYSELPHDDKLHIDDEEAGRW